MTTVAARNVAHDSYMRLIREFPLRRITTASDHQKAKRIVMRLSNQHADLGALEYLDVLVDLIADYERRLEQTIDTAGMSPAELIRHRMAERGISISALARQIDIPQSNLSEMLSGKRDWSKAAIQKISEHMNIRLDRFFARSGIR